jgi:hypothetical protein
VQVVGGVPSLACMSTSSPSRVLACVCAPHRGEKSGPPPPLPSPPTPSPPPLPPPTPLPAAQESRGEECKSTWIPLRDVGPASRPIRSVFSTSAHLICLPAQPLVAPASFTPSPPCTSIPCHHKSVPAGLSVTSAVSASNFWASLPRFCSLPGSTSQSLALLILIPPSIQPELVSPLSQSSALLILVPPSITTIQPALPLFPQTQTCLQLLLQCGQNS